MLNNVLLDGPPVISAIILLSSCWSVVVSIKFWLNFLQQSLTCATTPPIFCCYRQAAAAAAALIYRWNFTWFSDCDYWHNPL